MTPHRALVVLALVLLALTACGRNLTNPDGWSGAVVVEGVVYAGTGEGKLVALDRQTGESLWDFDLLGNEGARAVYGTPALSGSTMYVGGYDGFLYVFDIGGSTDPLNWAEPVLLDSKEVKTPLEEEPEPIVGGPSVVDEDCSDASGGVPCQIVMVGSSDNSVYTFEVTFESKDRASIRDLHRFETGGKVWSTPAESNGVAYFGSLDHKVYALSITSGDVIWEFETGGGVVASPVVANGRVYVGSFDSTFYALNAATGEEEWRFTDAGNWFWGGAVASSNTVFAPSLDGSLYALELGTGRLRWALRAEGRIVGAPALMRVLKRDLVVVGSDDGKGKGKVRVANVADGDLEGACTIEDEIRSSLATDGENVYMSVQDDTIRALSIGASGDLDEEWVFDAKEANALSGTSC